VDDAVFAKLATKEAGAIPLHPPVRGPSVTESAMKDAAMKDDHPAAILFDFEAAFPSVDHDFIMDVLVSRGWPTWLVNIIRLLYWNNCCCLSLGGVYVEGFSISAGVRQGCPLSPLVFAFISDVLLRKLARHVPNALIRAYADDIAIVLRNYQADTSALEFIFYEYGCSFLCSMKMGNASGYRYR
jgi:hypothetical protein